MKKQFTIIELIVSLGIFAIMLVMMINMFTDAQRVQRSTEGLTRVHENARTIFDTIENDFLHAEASNQSHREIPFAVIKGENGSGPFPCMVSQVASTSSSRSNLAEVTYDLNYATRGGEKLKDIGGEPIQFFRRAVTPDRLSGGNINQKWDFYNIDTKTNNLEWTKSRSQFHPIAPGVIALKFNFRGIHATNSNYEVAAYNLSTTNGTRSTNIPAIASHKLYPTSGNYYYLPKTVDIELTLYDPKTETAKNATKTRKTFFKRIFVKQGPRNF